MSRVKNKIALITGASRGIGAATAELLVTEGAHVILTDVLDQPGEALAARLDAEYYHLDVSCEHDFKKVFEIVKNKYGHLDILFNNAGITGYGQDQGLQDPENISLEDWDHVHDVNLKGVFLGCKYGIKLMKDRGGSIINMSSRSGLVGIPACAAYASSKAAIRNHTKTVALYCAQQGYNIRCNSLHPGAILTPMWDEMLGDEPLARSKAIEMIANDIPLKKMGEPLDVAYAVLYLGSDESKYITGIELTLDGGILAGSAASPAKSQN